MLEVRGVVFVSPVNRTVCDEEGLLVAQRAHRGIRGEVLVQKFFREHSLHGAHSLPTVGRDVASWRELVGNDGNHEPGAQTLGDHEGNRVLPQLVAEAIVSVTEHDSFLL